MITPLSETNLKILTLLSQGLTIKEVACRIYLTRSAVAHRLEVMRTNAGARTGIELVFIHYDQIKQQNMVYLPLTG